MWSGRRALEVGLVDALGGISRAVAIAKKELKIGDGEEVSLIELSRESASPLALLSGGGASAPLGALLQACNVLVALYPGWSALHHENIQLQRAPADSHACCFFSVCRAPRLIHSRVCLVLPERCHACCCFPGQSVLLAFAC